jgi:hypothetical protein
VKTSCVINDDNQRTRATSRKGGAFREKTALFFLIPRASTLISMDKETLTIASVAKSCGSVEFCDTDGLRAMFGIKRSLAYELLGAGLIRGTSLRREGRTRGKRLFDVASVRRYLESRTE